jgi:type I restriction enzyme S subunit
MNAERLLAHFERISEAPDAITRLRRFILDLAVRGKLVEPPMSWLECSLGDVGDWGSGGTPLRTKPEYYGGDIPWLVIGDLNDGLVTASVTTITEEGLSNSSAKVVDEGTLLIAMYGSIGKLGVAGMRCATNQAIAFCRPYSDMVTGDYLFVLLKSLRNELLLQGQGVAQQNISQKILKAHPVELPPLAEQHRIVAKVNELMALCDQLESARQERQQGRERLMTATLQRLNQPAEDPANFRNDASFALQVLSSLTTTPAQIKQLRQTILNLAVRGKLVEQDPEDEPAEELLILLATEKQTQRNGRNWEANASVAADPLFDMPRGWHLTVVAATARRVTVGYVGPMKDQYVADGIPFLRSQNVRANRFREDGLVYISRDFHAKISKSSISPGDVVVVRSGNVGTACAIPASISEGNCSDLVIIQEPICVCPEYLCFYLNSMAQAHVASGTVGVALTHFNTKSVANMPIPLPPLAEQHRIVAKVDTLLALCDQLEQQLSQADQQRLRLLEAVLAEALQSSKPALGSESRV